MAEFFHMGGHGFFVWTSYAIVFAVFLYNFIAPILKRKALISQLRTAANYAQKRSNHSTSGK